MGWIPYSSTYCQPRVGSYSYILLCLEPKSTTSQGLEWTMFICCGKLPGLFDWGPGSVRQVNERGGRGRQVAKSCLPMLDRRVEK
jgi:hypothetical protein